MPALSTYRGGGASSVGVGNMVQQVRKKCIDTSAHTSTTSTSMASTGFDASITPTNSSNNILVEMQSNMAYGQSQIMYWGLYRSGTGVTDGYLIDYKGNYTSGNYVYSWIYNSTQNWMPITAHFLDTTHSTTDELTYTLYHRKNSGSGTAYTSHREMEFHITLTEIQT